MHVGEDESFYRPVNISDNDWRDVVYFQQADGVMLVEGTALAVIKYSELVPHRGHKFPRTDIDPGSIAFGDGILRVAILFLVEQGWVALAVNCQLPIFQRRKRPAKKALTDLSRLTSLW